jgi:hypothetical protein
MLLYVKMNCLIVILGYEFFFQFFTFMCIFFIGNFQTTYEITDMFGILILYRFFHICPNFLHNIIILPLNLFKSYLMGCHFLYTINYRYLFKSF